MKTLKQLRVEQGYTCKEVAEAVGITEVYHFSQEDSFLKEREGSQHSE